MSTSAGSRRGFTLIELLVSLIMLVIVGGALYQLLITVQRVSGKQTEVSNMQGNLRSGMQLLQTELSEVATNASTPSSDIISMATTGPIRYRAMRGFGETCEITTTSVKVRQDTWNGRIPTATTDRLFFLWDRDSTLVTDDTWLNLAITGVAGSTCPDGVTASWTLSVTLTADQRDSTYAPSPVRTWEDMEVGKVTSSGQDWLGIRSVSGGENTLVPVVGPLTTDGLTFEFRRADDATTTDVNLVKTIGVMLKGITDRRVNTGVGSAQATIRDSLQFRIQLRNSK